MNKPTLGQANTKRELAARKSASTKYTDKPTLGRANVKRETFRYSDGTIIEIGPKQW